MKKRFRMLALLLSACMMLNLAPMSVLAAEVTTATEEVATEAPATAEDSKESTEEETTKEEKPVEEQPSEEKSSEEPAEDAEKGEKAEVVTDENTTSDASLADENLTIDPAELEEIPLDMEAELLAAKNENPYFTVKDDGTLALKEGIKPASLPSEITLDMLKEAGDVTVTKIPTGIFDNSNITKITIPTSVSQFDVGAFQDCVNLSIVKFENDTSDAKELSENLFKDCVKLRMSANGAVFKIPAGITKIGKSAFEECESLTDIDFSKAADLTEIADHAFSGCSNLDELKSLSTGTKLVKVGKYAFKGTKLNYAVRFPSTLKTIDSYAFWNCKKLGRVHLENIDNITLAAGCFANSGITSIVLPGSYNTIEPNVFENCLNLRDITIGSDTVDKNVGTIKTNAFKDCKNLQTVTLNASVSQVDNDAFAGCSSLTSVKIYNRGGEDKLSAIKLFADSFPSNAGLVISSYGGTAEEWAGSHTEDGVKYQSMFAGMQVVVNGNKNGNTVTANPSSNVKVGDKITLTAKNAPNYALISLTRGERADSEKYSEVNFVDSSKQIIASSADINSDGKIQVDAAFTNVSTLDDTFKFVTKEGTPVIGFNNTFDVRYETANQTSQLGIKVYSTEYETIFSNPWLWTFASSDSKVVSVDANGKLRLLKKTDEDKPVKITAKLKSKPSIVLTLNVYVGKQTEFDHIEDVTFGKAYNFTSGLDPESGLKYIQTSKAWLEAATSQKKTRNVDVSLIAKDLEGTEIQSTYKWVSDNTSIVKVAAANTTCNDNTLQVCGVGETTVTATSTVDASKSYSFIVRVVDLTPYVKEAALTVNARATKVSSTDVVEDGLEFSLIQAYGGTISNNHIEVMKKEGNKYVSLKDSFAVDKSGKLSGNVQKLVLGIKKEGPNGSANPYYTKNASYTNFYLKLMVNGSYYYVLLPKVTVVNKTPQPSVKIAGKINSFYKRDAAEQTVVTATINTPAGFTFEKAVPYLESDVKADPEKNFSSNFKVTPVVEGDYSKLNISLKNDTLVKDSRNKIINTGYLCIQYKGDYPVVKLKVTVPYGRTAPALAFEKGTVTTHINAEKQSFEIGLINKTTKKNVELDETYTIDTYTTSSSDYFFDTKNSNSGIKKRGGDEFLHPAKDEENNKVVISLGKQAPKSNVKAVVLVENSEWTEDITLPVTVAVTKAAPTVALGNKGNIDLNLSANSDSNNISFEVKSDYVDKNTIEFEEFKPTATNQKVIAEASKIAVTYDKEKGAIVAKINKENVPAVGTYAFKANYSVNYVGGQTKYNSNTTVRVVISKKDPKLTLKNGTFTLNNTLVGVVDSEGNPIEVATTTYTISNIAADAWDSLNKDYLLSDITNSRNIISYEKVSDSPISLQFADGVMSVYLKEVLTGTHKYKVSNLTVDGLKLPDVIFTVKTIAAEPTITLSGKGTINVLEPNTAVTYTLGIRNFGGTIDPSKLVIESQDTSAAANASWVTSGFAFKLDKDSVDGKTIKLVANEVMKGKIESRKYTMRVYYEFGTKKGDVVTSPGIKISTKPIQTMPKLTLDATTATVYSGTRSQVAKIKVTPKEGSTATITGVKWNTNTNATLQRAFATPSYDPNTNELSIQLKNPALLKKNTTYTLNYVIICDGQLANTNGTAFSIKVTVK